MSKVTQSYRLYQLLKAAAGSVSKKTIAEELGIEISSVPVYIHEFKKSFKLKKDDLLSVRNGKQVTGYQLNKKEIKVPEFRKNAAGVAPPKKVVAETTADNTGILPVLDGDASQISDREMADVKSSLGIGGFGGGYRGSDY
jgi:hypothetical protein